jgi:hypothetical protein
MGSSIPKGAGVGHMFAGGKFDRRARGGNT